PPRRWHLPGSRRTAARLVAALASGARPALSAGQPAFVASAQPSFPAAWRRLAGDHLPDQRQRRPPRLPADPAQAQPVRAGAVAADLGGEGRLVAGGKGRGPSRMVVAAVG